VTHGEDVHATNVANYNHRKEAAIVANYNHRKEAAIGLGPGSQES